MELRELELSFLAPRQSQQVSLYKYINRSDTSCVRRSVCSLRSQRSLAVNATSSIEIFLLFTVHYQFILDKSSDIYIILSQIAWELFEFSISSIIVDLETDSKRNLTSTVPVKVNLELHNFLMSSQVVNSWGTRKLSIRFRFESVSNDQHEEQNSSLNLYGHII